MRGKKTGDDNVDSDIVDEMLAFYSDEEVEKDEDLQGPVRLTRNNIKAIIMDIMFGGTETVASAIEWVMAELMHTPTGRDDTCTARASRYCWT
ncbi:putative cytochrome P450 [Helianthus annuus]|nr:putative cytochrome P450 [Helianthus annuus]KAJ0656199.1 putative cytochrome P450 [Helianthus annuus]